MSQKIRIYEEIAINPDEIKGKVDFCLLFEKTAPIHFEIGSGKGTFLVNQAKAFPDINFLGLEWANKYYKHAVDRLGRWGLKNVRMLRADAAVFIDEHIPDQSISCYHIYFPDPWPKKRHHKRRFICRKNLEQLHCTLVADGIVNIATDHAEYFQWINEALEAESDKFERIDYIVTAGAQGGEIAGTNFERKYIKEGREVYTAAVRKI